MTVKLAGVTVINLIAFVQNCNPGSAVSRMPSPGVTSKRDGWCVFVAALTAQSC